MLTTQASVAASGWPRIAISFLTLAFSSSRDGSNIGPLWTVTRCNRGSFIVFILQVLERKDALL
jgi:hypothetical protein